MLVEFLDHEHVSHVQLPPTCHADLSVEERSSVECPESIEDVGRGVRWMVRGPDGRRYVSDETNHRVLIIEADGRARHVGQAGSGVAEFQFPRGLALLADAAPHGSRLYVCDAWNDRIQVLDEEGLPVGGFGGHGSGPGLFDVPSDIVIVRPRFPDEALAPGSPGEAMLAISDRWNNRIQILEPDGSFVAVLAARRPDSARGEVPALDSRVGWPFFSVTPHPAFWLPTRLAWRDPYLVVTCAGGEIVDIDLPVALLPSFDTWRERASIAELTLAAETLRSRHESSITAGLLAQIETTLGGAFIAQSEWDRAASLWRAGLASGLGSEEVTPQLEQRLEHVLMATPSEGSRALTEVLVSQVGYQRRPHNQESSAHGDQARCRGTDQADRVGGSTHCLTRLWSLAIERSGGTYAQGTVVWTAPSGEGDLRHLAVTGDRVALVSNQARALWIFDRQCKPVARFELASTLSPTGVAAHPGGGWLVSDETIGRLVYVDARGRVEGFWPSTRSHAAHFASPVGLATAADRVYVADRDSGSVKIHDLDGRVLGGYTRLQQPSGLAVSGDSLWIAGARQRSVRRLGLRSGETEAELMHARCVSLAQVIPAGEDLALVSDEHAGCVHAFAAGGEWLGALTAADGRPLGQPCGLVLLADRVGLVADSRRGQLIRFDLPSLERGWWSH